MLHAFYTSGRSKSCSGKTRIVGSRRDNVGSILNMKIDRVDQSRQTQKLAIVFKVHQLLEVDQQ